MRVRGQAKSRANIILPRLQIKRYVIFNGIHYLEHFELAMGIFNHSAQLQKFIVIQLY